MKPIPCTKADIDDMDATRLRDASIYIYRIHRAFSTEGFEARMGLDIGVLKCDKYLRSLCLLPGGTSFLLVTRDYNLHLYQVGCVTPMVSLPGVGFNDNIQVYHHIHPTSSDGVYVLLTIRDLR